MLIHMGNFQPQSLLHSDLLSIKPGLPYQFVLIFKNLEKIIPELDQMYIIFLRRHRKLSLGMKNERRDAKAVCLCS